VAEHRKRGWKPAPYVELGRLPVRATGTHESFA